MLVIDKMDDELRAQIRTFNFPKILSDSKMNTGRQPLTTGICQTQLPELRVAKNSTAQLPRHNVHT